MTVHGVCDGLQATQNARHCMTHGAHNVSVHPNGIVAQRDHIVQELQLGQCHRCRHSPQHLYRCELKYRQVAVCASGAARDQSDGLKSSAEACVQASTKTAEKSPSLLTCVPIISKVVHAVRSSPVRQQYALVAVLLLHVCAQIMCMHSEGHYHSVFGDIIVQGRRHTGQPSRQQLIEGVLAACMRICNLSMGLK